MKLECDLIPASSFFTNLRSMLKIEVWDALRSSCYRRVKYKCEICGGRGRQHPVECHEVWSYDETTCIQKLERLIALCPKCHMVKHFGLAQMQGNEDTALKHLMKVNVWSLDEAVDHVNASFAVWERRGQIEWKLDISKIKHRS